VSAKNAVLRTVFALGKDHGLYLLKGSFKQGLDFIMVAALKKGLLHCQVVCAMKKHS